MLQFDADFASVRARFSVRPKQPAIFPPVLLLSLLSSLLYPPTHFVSNDAPDGEGGPPEGPLGVARQGRSGRARPPSIQSAPGQGLNTVAHEVPAEQDQPNMSNIPLYYHFFHITRPPPRRPLDGICSIDTSCFFLPIVLSSLKIFTVASTD